MNRLRHVALLSCISFSVVWSQPLADSLLHRLISKGIDLTLRQKYVEADSVFRSAATQFPNHPAGYLYQAGVLQARALDYVIPLNREPFDSLLGVGERLAENLIESNENSPWGYYFLGTAYGYDAYARVERGDWFGGIRKGLSAASNFKSCVEKDPKFYDAFGGLGTYYYWKSRKIEFLHWLPFITDDRDEGIRLLKGCFEHGTYNRFVALSALVTIYQDAGQYDQSAWAAREAVNVYPENRIFLWGLAEAYMRLAKRKDALETYGILLKSIIADSLPNPYSEILCRLNISKMKIQLGDTTDIRTHLQVILSFESHDFPPELKSRAEAKFTEARNFLERLRNHRSAGN